MVWLVLADGAVDWRFGPLRVRGSHPGRGLWIATFASAAAAASGWRRPGIRGLAVGAGGMCGLFWAAVWAQSAPLYVPSGDLAVLESYTLHATTGQALLGPYSRYQWNHPGPLYFYVLAPLYSLSGFNTAALFATAAAINVAALGLAGWVAYRSARATLALSITAAAAFLAFRITNSLATAWNPHVLIFPVMALLVVSAALAAGRVVLLPVVAVVATFLVQTHVSLLPTVISVSGASLAALFATMRSRSDAVEWRRFGRVLNATGWLLAGLWLLPIAEDIAGTPGNLTELWRFFAVEDRPGQSLNVAFHAWAAAAAASFSPGLEITRSGVLRLGAGSWTPWVALTLAIGAAAVAVGARRQADTFRQALGGLVAVALAASLWSVTRITDEIVNHALFWISGLGVLAAALMVDTVAGRVRGLRSQLSPRRAALGCALLALLGALPAITQARSAPERMRHPSGGDFTALRLWQALSGHPEWAQVQKPLIRIDHPTWEVAAGLVLQLQKSGVPVAVENRWLSMFTDEVAAVGDEDATLTVARPLLVQELLTEPGHVILADRDGVFLVLGPAR